MTVYSSDWMGLNEHLIASFFEVDKKGDRIDSSVEVKAPIIDGNVEATFNWQSPFENSGPETKAPTVMGMLQNGEAQSTATAVARGIDNVFGTNVEEKVEGSLKLFEGRTGITKLNSTQVFTGMPPVKIPITILFRAWKDANKEVEKPFDQLMKWSVPVELSSDGTALIRLAKNGFDKELFLPSVVPTMIGMKYKNRMYSPLVIESINYSLISPIEKNGKSVELSVQLTLATLTALDRNDWDVISAGGL